MKRKILSVLSLFFATITFFVGCNSTNKNSNSSSEQTQITVPTAQNKTPFRLSTIVDETNENSIQTYSVKAPYTDDYSLTSSTAKSISIYNENELLASGSSEIEVSLTKDEIYTLQVETQSAKEAFTVVAKALNNLVTLPYEIAEPVDVSNVELQSEQTVSPLKSATVDYQKRSGGTYIYSNNPELIPADSVGDAFISTSGLKGEVYFTFEHANYSGDRIYLGYQVKNEGNSDVYVTVTNIGYQAGGTWFGQRAWYDFYNTNFTLPEDYLVNGAISSKYSNLDYAYSNYTPRVFQPVTYRLPAGEYFYVIGGTTKDSYNGINVNRTADLWLANGRCANGNVKFEVTGGEVTGTFYAYNNVEQVKANPKATGYRVGAYAAQYMGTANHSGIIDNHMQWTFNDATPNGLLPVTYTNVYDESAPDNTTPYEEYNNKSHVVNSTSWMTHLNPQNDHRAVGSDIVEFVCTDENGNSVTIDNYHADGAGNKANTANWMIEYQDHFTFINQGNEERTVTLKLKDHGSLALLVRDNNGKVIATRLTAGLGGDTYSYTYVVTIPAHSVKQITLDYVLVACSYGSVMHYAELG